MPINSNGRKTSPGSTSDERVDPASAQARNDSIARPPLMTLMRRRRNREEPSLPPALAAAVLAVLQENSASSRGGGPYTQVTFVMKRTVNRRAASKQSVDSNPCRLLEGQERGKAEDRERRGDGSHRTANAV